ncbi:hypothetical protein AaE_000419 [Aphanomyces astaci]|uniref:Reverse transcriptase domain-containing protein n=1 Tax=Aphanomyces astaci TaxID=112090 RepID=A0A6A5AKU5_APHAT|nr:hypothetical protein AaE_000419 [Aphanomyces astaci]
MGLGAAHRPRERTSRLAYDYQQPAHQRVHGTYAKAYAEPRLRPDCLVGTRAFFTLDWFKGYRQLALHEDSQMFYSFMTPFGVYTPTRVLMGQTDAVAFCQSAVDFMFADLLYS